MNTGRSEVLVIDFDSIRCFVYALQLTRLALFVSAVAALRRYV